MPLEIVFFKSEAGNQPVKEFLMSRAKEDRKEIGADIYKVQEWFPVAGIPNSTSIPATLRLLRHSWYMRYAIFGAWGQTSTYQIWCAIYGVWGQTSYDRYRVLDTVTGWHFFEFGIAVPVGLPLVRKEDIDLWEVRSTLPDGICRILFTVTKTKMVLLHGFIKKTQKTPPKELEIARNRQKEFNKLSKRIKKK